MRTPALGDSRSKFRLIAELGSGGMGVVYLAVVSGLGGFNKLQVVKKLRSELAQDRDSLTMFMDEARLAACLNHPNVVQTNEVGSEGNEYFIAMEYLEGQSFDQIVRRARATGGVPLPVALRILRDILAGLHHAHELRDFDGVSLGLVHRDVTPQNVFVTYDGASKLLDFGIAKAASSSHQTRAGTLKGKYPYMSAEQIKGNEIDRRADIFSVGAILWQAATGEHMWKGENELNILTRVVENRIPLPRSVNPNVSEELEAICMRALAGPREDRYATALEMQLAIEHFIEQSGNRASDREVSAFVSALFATERAAMKSAVDDRLREMARTSERRLPCALPLLPRTEDPVSASTNASASVSDYGSDGSLQPVMEAGSVHRALAPAPRKRTGLAIGMALALAGFTGLGVHQLSSRGQPSAAGPAPALAAETAVVRATNAESGPPARGDGAVTTVHIAATPPSARIFVDDAAIASNPLDTTFARDGMSHMVRAEAPGYRTKTELVTFKEERISLTFALLESEAPRRNAGIARVATPPAPPPPTPPRTIDTGLKPTPPPKGSIDTIDPWAAR